MAQVQTTTNASSQTRKRPNVATLPDIADMGRVSGLNLSDRLAQMSADDRKAVFDTTGKELAKLLGSDLVAQMLSETKLSQRAIDEETGYNHSALSRMARGEAKSGPTLWKLFALADALGFKLELKLSRK